MRDNCTRCLGEQGGVRGNENVIIHVIDGLGGVRRVVCDYCHAALTDGAPWRWEPANPADADFMREISS